MLVILILVLYFVPTFIAASRKKQNSGSVFALNFFLGWTFIGWVIALVWALNKDSEPAVVIHAPERHKSVSGELVELFKLKEKGAITEEEFQAHKAKLLK